MSDGKYKSAREELDLFHLAAIYVHRRINGGAMPEEALQELDIPQPHRNAIRKYDWFTHECQPPTR